MQAFRQQELLVYVFDVFMLTAAILFLQNTCMWLSNCYEAPLADGILVLNALLSSTCTYSIVFVTISSHQKCYFILNLLIIQLLHASNKNAP